MLHVEAYLLTCAVTDALCLLLGGRMAGLCAPSWRRLTMGVAGSALLSLLSQLVRSPLPGLLGMVFSVTACYRPCGRPAVLRAMVTCGFSGFLLGGAGVFLSGALGSARTALWAGCALSLLLWPLLSLVPTTLTEVKQVELRYAGRAVLLPAMVDSGNLLTDAMTGLPVMVVGRGALESLLPELSAMMAYERLPAGFRLLSVRTAAGHALMPLFRPDECVFYLNGEVRRARVMVAIASEQYDGVQALVPARAVMALGSMANGAQAISG